MRVAVAAIVLTGLAGCYHPTAATGAPCASNGECPDGQYCDPVTTTCTAGTSPATDAKPADAAMIDAPPQCVASSDCPPTAPICAQQQCRGCAADSECAPLTGGACHEFDGTCIADADTIYVAATGTDSGTCTAAAPCATITYALEQLAGTRLTIAIGDGAYAGAAGSPAATIAYTGGRVVLSGLRRDWTGGATLTAMTNGTTNPAVVVTNSGTNVVIEGIAIQNGGYEGVRASGSLWLSHVDVDGNHADGVNVLGTTSTTRVWSSRIAHSTNVGLVSQSTMDVQRSQILANAQGGIFGQRAAITIVNTIVAQNGSINSQVGGILLQNLNGMAPTLAFDTIVDNMAKTGGGTTTSAGLSADSTVAVVISDSILYGNNNGSATALQICTTCTATWSLYSGTAPAGTNNITGEPAFVNPVGLDYHITSTSAARSAADPSSANTVDVDGEMRPQGTGFDMGADEIP